MTPEYTPDTIAMVLRCLRVQTEGPGPICPVCVHQAGLVAYDEQSGNRITAAGYLVLAIAAERDAERATNAKTADAFVGMLERISRELNAALAETQEVKERLRGELELLKLRCEWQEARAASYAAQLEYAELNPEMPHDEVSIEALNEADDTMMAAAEKRDAARAAYVAAGGEV